MLVDEDKSNILSISTQCQILKLPRSVYYEKRGYTISDEEKESRALLKEEHNKHLDKVLTKMDKSLHILIYKDVKAFTT